MKRVAHPPRGLVGAVAAIWALALVTALLGATRPHPARPGSLALGLLVVAGLVWFSLWALLPRATVQDGRLALRALRAKERLRSPMDEVTGYRMDKAGEWWVETATRRVRVAVQEPWELHRAFIDLAPKALGARKMRFPGVPPVEEFTDLWTYDVDELVSRAKGTLLAVALLLIAFRRGSFVMVGQIAILFLVPAIEGWGRIDVTREGIVRRGPLHRRTIRWSDAKAIFREGRPGKRSFVIVGQDCAIHLPAHLAIDRDVIEKVLYSLPDPILVVNFDETTLRGYKRRKKARSKEPARGDDLLPALTA